jgi:uncharacterized protein
LNTELNAEILIIVLAGFTIGIIIGALVTRMFAAPGKQKRFLSEELRQNLQTSATYQHEVTEHFVKTSNLVKSLTGCYAELHQHLADGATKLANPETGRQLAEAGSVQLELILPESHIGEGPQAPRDYAPGNGVLSEDYGFTQADLDNKSSNIGDTALDQDADITKNAQDAVNDPGLKAG